MKGFDRLVDMHRLTLTLLPGLFAICRLPADSPLPARAHGTDFLSITRTRAELSIVCAQAQVPDGVQSDGGWRCLRVEGPFDLDGTIGVLAALSVPLAEAGISLFAVGTYDTDYLLVKDTRLSEAISVLGKAGQRVDGAA